MRKVLIIVLIIIVLVGIGFVVYTYLGPKLNPENQKIETWIKANNLNEYGDPQNTAYSGGTPLFNEATGQKIDRYDYIQKMHPDKPWNR